MHAQLAGGSEDEVWTAMERWQATGPPPDQTPEPSRPESEITTILQTIAGPPIEMGAIDAPDMDAGLLAIATGVDLLQAHRLLPSHFVTRHGDNSEALAEWLTSLDQVTQFNTRHANQILWAFRDTATS
ncbi:MAG TPA: hypothetical protein VLA31_04435 [Burkholderiaceae bacterium]|nr:hypothetical protein [Burkholderiaceae bacterium]